jgi:hypothetical protein
MGIRYLVEELLPKMTSEFVLIIGSEDYTFPTGRGDVRYKMYRGLGGLIAKLLDSPLLLDIYVENLDTAHIKLHPIPLGVFTSGSFPIDILESVDFTLKPTLCLCHHRTRKGNQWTDRLTANDLAKTAWNGFVKLIEKETDNGDFIRELKQAKFVLCIHGGGYDPCPRFFECILYGGIPIIQHSPLDEVFLKFPVVFIGNLTEGALSEDFLLDKLTELKEFYVGEKRKQVLEMLTLDYWWKIITAKIKYEPTVVPKLRTSRGS